MTEPTPGQKMLANVRHLRKNGAPRERIQQEIEYWRGEIDKQNAEERKLSGVEKVAGFLSTMGGGATFNTTDEAVGMIPKYGQSLKDEQRFLQRQFREEHPVVSFGAEVLGGLAVPGAILKQAPRAASFGKKALTVLGEGALQGGASGLGAAEGGITERAIGAGEGGAAGSVVAGLIAGLTRGGSKIIKGARDMRSPLSESDRLARIADETGDTDIAQARTRLAEFEGARLGDEVMPADVLPQGEGALRSQAVAGGKETRKIVDAALRQRSNRLSNLAEDRFSEYTGTQKQSARKTEADLVREAQQEARPYYERAESEAAGREPIVEEIPTITTAQSPPKDLRTALREFDQAKGIAASRNEGTVDQQRARRALERHDAEASIPAIRGESRPHEIVRTESGKPPLDEGVRAQLRAATELPAVKDAIARIRKDAPYKGLAPDDHRVLDQAYKEIGEDVRLLRDKRSSRTISVEENRSLKRMIEQRKELRDAINARSPLYGEALGRYADPMARLDAYRMGNKNTPADLIPSELDELEGVDVDSYKAGKAQLLRPKTSNPDLGEFARFRDVIDVFSDPEKAASFKATFGEDKYRDMLRDVLQMAHLQRMRGGAGESTSVDKLLEQAIANPDAIAGIFKSLASGNPIQAVTQLGRFDKVIEGLRRSKGAKANAETMTQLGSDKTRIVLDLLEKLRAEGRMPRRKFEPFKASTGNAALVGSRVAGGWAGRP